MDDEVCIPIKSESDIVIARQRGRALAEHLGFDGSDLTIIATAISEVARNIVQYAKKGEVTLKPTNSNLQRGIMVIAQDQGPGIADIGQAMQDGYSTGSGLGLGLPGARRLMDKFTITSKVGNGTTISMIKWVHSDDSNKWKPSV
jgi:serine/threonine-protein kinase RsbT